MIDAVHLGRNVRSIRLLQGMKQELFAQKMGVSQQQVSKLERQQHISFDKLEAVAKALDVPVGVIRAFEENSFLHNKNIPEISGGDVPMKELMDYFLAELAKKDRIIADLQTKLNEYQSSDPA